MAPRSSPTKTKTLVLIRHAHRDKPWGREADNGLSGKGRRQAQRIVDFYLDRFGSRKARILSSPKIRCVETVEPLSKEIGRKVSVMPLLAEGDSGERLLASRTREFLEWWRKKGPRLTVVCSHGDWIPLLLKQQFGLEIPLKKGGWVEIEQKEAQLRLRWLVQVV